MEHFCEIFRIWTCGSRENAILNSTDLELWRPFDRRRRAICSILVEGIMRSTSVKLFCILTNGSVGDVFKGISHLELWQPFCSAEWNQ